jgi:transketolase
MLPFASTFAAFMSSRAKDQARVNDISRTNVKMVATHAGLSVGEDGPTHQAIDDSGSFVGLLHTGVLEPADPNQCDHMVRFIAGHYGNYYMRMGRHKFAVLTKEDGTPYYDENYQYTYGKTDRIRTGSYLTIAATGALVGEAVKAWESLKAEGIEVEVIAVSSIKHYDEVLLDSIRKTGRVLTLEDHNTYSGLGAQLARTLLEKGIQVKSYHMSGVDEYQLSGKGEELYHKMGLDTAGIIQKVKSLG